MLRDGGDVWSYAHLLAVILSLGPTIISIMDPKRARFENALAHIGFGPGERDTFVQASGYVNACMVGLPSPEQVSGICKRLATRNVNPVALMAIQEQLLLALCFWVAVTKMPYKFKVASQCRGSRNLSWPTAR